MGIRFLCPNGHKLNVKSFLAGKRGICPECDAKFLVPQESGGLAEAVVVGGESLEEGGGSGDASHRGYLDRSQMETATPVESTLPPPMPAAAAVAEQSSAEVWYVRSAAGEQFGPASTEVMQGWVAEGRVPVDSWVWRTGWPEWRTGGQAITFLNGPPAVPTAAALATAPVPDMPEATPQPEVPVEGLEVPLPAAVERTTVLRSSRRSRQERARKVTFFLGGVVLLLFAVLVVVLVNNSR